MERYDLKDRLPFGTFAPATFEIVARFEKKRLRRMLKDNLFLVTNEVLEELNKPEPKKEN